MLNVKITHGRVFLLLKLQAEVLSVIFWEMFFWENSLLQRRFWLLPFAMCSHSSSEKRNSYVILCTISYHLCNLKKLENNYSAQFSNYFQAQVLSLLQMNSGKADGERIAQLERALSQANAENQSLMKKIKEAETKQVQI